MSKPTITVLVGMIGSGKSTYCKLAAEKGYIIVNDDAIVNALHGNKYKLYEPVLKPLYKSIENHIIAVAIASQRSVVVDRGLDICVKARRRWIALANSLDVLCNSVIFPKDKVETHAYRRVMSDPRGYDYATWLAVAQKHQQVYVEPTVEEGFNQIFTITWEEIQNGTFKV